MYKKRSPGEPAPQKTHKKAEKRCPGVKKMSGSGRKNARWEIKNWRARRKLLGPKMEKRAPGNQNHGHGNPLNCDPGTMVKTPCVGECVF